LGGRTNPETGRPIRLSATFEIIDDRDPASKVSNVICRDPAARDFSLIKAEPGKKRRRGLKGRLRLVKQPITKQYYKLGKPQPK